MPATKAPLKTISYEATDDRCYANGSDSRDDCACLGAAPKSYFGDHRSDRRGGGNPGRHVERRESEATPVSARHRKTYDGQERCEIRIAHTDHRLSESYCGAFGQERQRVKIDGPPKLPPSSRRSARRRVVDGDERRPRLLTALVLYFKRRDL
jgi:hypothetical protein